MPVDHIVELRDGGEPLSRSNPGCWRRLPLKLKTAAERARRTAERPGGRRCKPGRPFKPHLAARRENFRSAITQGGAEKGGQQMEV
jgi:hypothetical protein